MTVAAIPSRRRTIGAVALCAAAYLYAFPYFPALNNPNENVRFYMTAALVEEGTYRIDSMRERWGWVNDAAAREGHYYSVKAPLTSFLGVPAYAAYHALAGDGWDRTTAMWLVRVSATVAPVLVFLFFFYGWLGARTRSPGLRDAVFLSVALGSLLFGYTYLFVSHTTSAAAAFGAFMLLQDARASGRASHGRAFLAGLLASATPALEYPAVVAGLALTVYAIVALRPRQTLASFVAGGLLPAAAVMHFQHHAFGNALTPGHLMVETDALRAAHHEGLYGATGFHSEAALSLLFDWRWGLFVLTPVLLFAFVGFARLLRDRRSRVDAGFAVALIASMYLVICLMNNWWGGWSIGPRYLAVVVPFVAWGALAGLEPIVARRKRTGLVLALGCTVAAFVVSGIPSAFYPHVPPGIHHPMIELYALLLRDGFAPSNLLNHADVWGTASMLPLGALLLAAVPWAASGDVAGRDRLIVPALALVLGASLAAPHFARFGHPAPTADLAVVTRAWHPEGRDRAARLAASLAREPNPDPDALRELADVYLSQGRTQEARAVMRRATGRRTTPTR